METLNEKIKKFLAIGYGYGGGDGGGSGYGDGYGDGSGDGSGSGYGSGGGSGGGDGISSFGRHKVYYIDGIATVIRSVYKGVARGFIVNNDLTITECVIVKDGDLFAHGNNIKSAENALQEKIFSNMNTDGRIAAFREKFKSEVKYPAKDFYDWHNKLTGSCEFGRKSFAKDNGINLETDSFTVREFIEITQNAYGGEIIKRLAEVYCER